MRHPIGRVSKAHGVRGEIQVRVGEPGSPALEGARRCFLKGREYAIQQSRPMGETTMLLKLEGVDDRTTAEGLRGLDVELDREDFPETAPGEYYLADLIGLKAVDPQGKELGRVAGLVETGAAPLLSVKTGERELLIPTVGPFIRRVDLSMGVIEIEPPIEGD